MALLHFNFGGTLFPVIVAAFFSFVVGMLWYSPALFGKQWMKLSKVDMKKGKEGMGQKMVLALVANLVLAYVFMMLIGMLSYTGVASGATLGFWIWLGFLATSLVGGVLWEGKPWGLYLINGSYWLVNLLVVGAVLGYFA